MWEFMDWLIESAKTDWNTNNTSPQQQPVTQNFGDLKTAQTQQSSAPKQQPKQVQVVPNKIKKWSKVSAKWFLIGCWVFFVILLLIVSFWLYFLVNNQWLLKNVGLEVQTVKSLLMVFAILFFGFLFFGSFLILVTNWYRLSTQKENKAKYALWAVLWFIVLLFSIVFGTVSILQIGKIWGRQALNSTEMVISYLQTKTENVPLIKWIPVIAPAYFAFELNKELFNRQVISKLPPQWSSIKSFELDCGNGQKLIAWPEILWKDSNFQWSCLYNEKQKFPVKLTYVYVNGNNWQDTTEELNVTEINVISKINVKIGWKEVMLNDNKDELMLGKMPAKVEFDARNLFTDLGLKWNKIVWDLNNDGKAEVQDKARIAYVFKQPDLYEIYYNLPTLPGFEWIYYGFNVRVTESDTANCSVKVEQLSQNDYKVYPVFKDWNEEIINTYIYNIEDTAWIIKPYNESKSVSSITYPLQDWVKYKINIGYETDDGKQWNCESLDYETKFSNYTLYYNIQWKSKSTDDFEIIWWSWDSEIQIDKVPYVVRLNMDKILPQKDGDVVALVVDGKEILPLSDNLFEFTMDQQKSYNAKIEVRSSWTANYTKDIKFNVKKKSTVAVIKAKPDNGREPLEVDFDASTSAANEAWDEILYFSWDFGDGQVYKNTSQWRVTHVYNYDKTNDNWIYEASVKITTKNWYEDTAKVKVTVQKQIKEMKINIEPPYTSQVARVGDSVSFSIETDWAVKAITWDFGNGKRISWDAREYIKANTVYDESGTYNIRAIVEYLDSPAVTANIKVKIIQ